MLGSTPVFSRGSKCPLTMNPGGPNLPKTKLNIIKPLLSLNELSDGDVLHHLQSVYDGMLNNPAYPNAPVDMSRFKAVIDAYTTAAAAAQHDGGKNAIIERDKRRADAIIMYRLFGHYVELACKNDLETFASSGFTAVSTGHRNPPQPVAVPLILSLDQGNTGQLLVTIRPVAHARHLKFIPAIIDHEEAVNR